MGLVSSVFPGTCTVQHGAVVGIDPLVAIASLGPDRAQQVPPSRRLDSAPHRIRIDTNLDFSCTSKVASPSIRQPMDRSNRNELLGAQAFDESVATWVCIVVAARTHNLAVEISLYKPMLVGRCFLICLPPSVLLATYGLLQLPRPVSGSALAVLAVASCSSVLSYYRHLGWKEDWRGATSFVISRCEAGDSVVVIPTYGRFTFEFDYYRGLAPAESKMLVYGEWEPGRSFPAPSTGA